MLKLDAGVLGGELPVGLGVACVSVFDPCVDLLAECVLIRRAAVEALGCQAGEFGLGQIKPGAVSRREMPFALTLLRAQFNNLSLNSNLSPNHPRLHQSG